jgi:protein SCO1/2
LSVLALVAVAGCTRQSAPAALLPGTKSYNARGIIRQIAADHGKVTIQHEAIPGYMSAMTMDFSVKDTNDLNVLAPSDEITFRLVVGENESWVEDLRFVAHRTGEATNYPFAFHPPVAELKTGDRLPDCELVAEDGRHLRLSDFRGRALAFSFFYSRCPLPDYCPRMSKNLSTARQLILATPGAPMNWQLLSISFDPGFDNPAVLSGYADFFRHGDTNHWLFAAAPTNSLAHLAPQLDLMVVRDGENITSHNLRTVVLDPQGRIFRQLDGNQWTPQELADAVLEAARQPAQP